MFTKKVFVCFIGIFCVITKAQIVQPNSDKNEDALNIAKKVSVTPGKLKEVDEIKDEIKTAVKENKYFVKSTHFLENGTENTSTENKSTFEKDGSTPNGTLRKDQSDNPSFGDKDEINSKIPIKPNVKNKSEKFSLLDNHKNDSVRNAFTGDSNTKTNLQNQIKDKNESNSAKGSLPIVTAADDSIVNDKKIVKVTNGQNESKSTKLKEEAIIQPNWTTGGEDQEAAKDVTITEEKLVETAEIRDEIQEAVKDHAHIIDFPSDEVVQEVDDYFQQTSHLREFLTTMIGSDLENFDVISDASDNGRNFTSLMDGSSKDDGLRKNSEDNDDSTKIIPNIVDSQIINDDDDDDDQWDEENSNDHFIHSNFDFTFRSTEILNLTMIEEDLDFTFGANVTQWNDIEYQGKAILVGVMDTSLIFLIKSNNGKFEQLYEILQMHEQIIDLELYIQWNSTFRAAEEIAVVAFKNRIICLKISTQEILEIWEIGRDITGLKYYKLGDSEFLAILTQRSNRKIGGPSINIYQFDLNHHDFWLSQIIPLEYPCYEIAFLNTGRDIILAVPQMNFIAIFSHNPNMQNQARFQRILTVQSNGVEFVCGFQMGGLSYLAIGGSQPQILRYHRGRFFQQTIFGQSFIFVERFIPITARTYRDDLILLVQHRINYETHSLPVIEPLIWNGEAFETSPSVPCLIGNVTIFYGANCLIDIERDDGIKGVAVISDYDGNDITLVVPRIDNQESGFFRIRTELIERNLEKDMDTAFAYLKNLVEQEENVIQQAETYIKQSDLDETSEARLTVKFLQAPQLSFDDGVIDEIFIGDHKWNDNDLTVNISAFLMLLEETEKDIRLMEHGIPLDFIFHSNTSNDIGGNYSIVQSEDDASSNDGGKIRKKRDFYRDVLEIENISIENLFIDEINGIPFEDVYFIKDDNLEFNGTIVIESDLKLESFGPESAEYKSVSDERIIEVENFIIDGDLNFISINEIPWRDLIAGIVLVNIPDDINDLEVVEEVFIEKGMLINELNDLEFPDEYLLSSGDQDVNVVKAEKRFFNTLTASVLEVDEGINDVNPSEFIILSADQWIPGSITFTSLEVTGTLEIFGTISGKGLNEIIQNPNLYHSKIIESNCIFNHLEVNGPITISGIFFNNQYLDQILNDVIYKNDENVLISSRKTFKIATFDEELQIEADYINDIHLDHFVTENTEQILNISSIFGEIQFNFMELKGLYDTINITELNENSVKIYGDQDTGVELIFENSNFLQMQSLNVIEYLNGESIEGFRTVFDNIEIDTVKSESFSAESLTMDCDITGSTTILNNIDLQDFDENRLSLSLNQTISSDLIVDNLIIENDVRIEAFNNFSVDFIFILFKKFENFPLMIQSGLIRVDGLNIFGDVTVNTLNGWKFNEDIQNRVIWLNRPNFVRINLRFLDPIVVDGALRVEGYLNNEHFPTFLEDIVFKTDNDIILSGPKRFIQYVTVVNKTGIVMINNIPFSELATRNNGNFKGSLYINGDLIVETLQVNGYFNDYYVNNLINSVQYDPELETFIFNDVIFKGHSIIENLHIHGSINEIQNFEQFLSRLVFKEQSMEIIGRKIFTNKPNFKSDFYIDTINGLNLTEFFANVIYVNQIEDDIVIDTPVTFMNRIETKSSIVKGELYTTNLMGCDIEEWITNSLRTDLNLNIQATILFDVGTLDSNSLHVLYANNIPMTDMISLHTPQNLSGHIYFSNLYLDDSLLVDGWINNVDLRVERENTLMINGNQHITIPTAFQYVRVLRNLEILTPINGKDLNSAATLNGDLELKSPISFKNITTKRILSYDDISGLNFSNWYQNSLWSGGRPRQVITGFWRTDYANIEGDITGNRQINGLSWDDIESQLDASNPEIMFIFTELESQQRKLCHKTSKLVEKNQNRVYFLKYFDQSIVVEQDGPINRLVIFTDKSKSETYLMVNVYCYSIIYRWRFEKESFEKVNGMETGSVQEFLAIPSSNGGILIVTNAPQNDYGCNIYGTNIWYLNEDQLIYNDYSDDIKNYESIYYSPENADRFYAIVKENNSMIEIDLDSHDIRSWNLGSKSKRDYRFVPFNVNVGIALSDGEHLMIVNNKGKNNNNSRQKRFLLKRRTPEEPINDSFERKTHKPEVESKFRTEIYEANNQMRKDEYIRKTTGILITLITDLEEQLKLQNKTEIELRPEDVNNIYENFQIVFSELIPDFSLNSSFSSGKIILTISDLYIAKRILSTFLKLKETQRFADLNYQRHDNVTKINEDETVGWPAPASVLALLRHSYTDLLNIWVRRGNNDIVGSSLENANNSNTNTAEIIKDTVQSIIERLKNEIDRLETLLESNEFGGKFNSSFDEVQKTMKIDSTNDFNKATIADQEAKPEEYPEEFLQATLSTNSSNKSGVIDYLKNFFGNLIQVLNTNPTNQTQLNNINVNEINSKMNELINTNSSISGFGNITTILSKFQNLTSIFNSTTNNTSLTSLSKLLDISLAIKRLFSNQNAQNQLQTDNNEIVGLPGSANFQGILSILRNTFMDVFNTMISRRGNDLVGNAQGQGSETIVSNSNEDIFNSLQNELEKQIENLNKFENDMAKEIINEFQTTLPPPSIEFLENDLDLNHDHDHDHPYQSTTEVIHPEFLDEPIVASEIPDQGLLVAYNDYLPGKSTDEILALEIGTRKTRQKLIAVTQSKEHLIPGQYDFVKLYYDIEQGHLFQSIASYRPRSLAVLHVRDETILAFIENIYLIRIFIYRGIEGFVEFMKFKSPQPITMLSTASLSVNCDREQYAYCLKYFLIAATDKKIQFYEAKMAGDHGVVVDLFCGN